MTWWQTSSVLTAAAEGANDGGPTWLAVLGAVGLGTVVSSVVTAVSLIVQNKGNAKREAERREEERTERLKERDHAAAEAQKERDHARTLAEQAHTQESERQREADQRASDERVREYWIDRRNEAHTDLLRLLRTMLTTMTSCVKAARWEAGKIKDGDHSKLVQQSLRDQTQEAIVRVAFLATDDARNRASDAWDFISTLDLDLTYAILIGSESLPEDSQDFRARLSEASTQLGSYTNAVRAELGTKK